jgi:hypothetical protein
MGKTYIVNKNSILPFYFQQGKKDFCPTEEAQRTQLHVLAVAQESV